MQNYLLTGWDTAGRMYRKWKEVRCLGNREDITQKGEGKVNSMGVTAPP